ncbi:DUF6049 family protein [Amycolatopsis nigrescens]|uniref:DUF6049 family protein n=1 Tax=Amycolatopsis nigrescens TaxID=381445 RepID=UPI0003606A0E|nr:DUF6049 family protein [Amycolatopsis nigrescens]
MKRFAALTLAVLFVVASALLGSGAEAQPVPDSPSRLRLDIGEMAPRLLTATSSTLSISGRVTNIGDRRLTGVKARLELGERQTTERQLRASLGEAPPTGASQTRYADVAATLEPGQSAPLTIVVRVNDGAGGLQVTRPGVYPLLVNVNGTPEYGDQARLAALSMLLPVLGVPGKEAPSKPDRPTKVAVLWPIADTRPRVVSAPFGGAMVLSDDQLANDLAPGGRLDALVSTVRARSGDQALTDSLCFAVDPDLLDTVDAMTRGYQVRTPQGLQEGRGVEAAKRWLGTLRQVVAGNCVIQLPYADTELSALTKVHDQDRSLISAATNGSQRLLELLSVQPQAGVLWPDGPLDKATLTELAETGTKTLIADPAKLKEGTPGSAATLQDSTLRAQPVDGVLATALAGTPVQAAGTLTPGSDRPLATQNGLAALAFHGLSGEPPSKPLLVAPPHRWTASVSELTSFLGTLSDFATRGLISPTPVQSLLVSPVDGTAKMSYSAQDTAAGVPSDVPEELSVVHDSALDLRSAMTVDPTTQVDPGDLIKPLRAAILRATSTAWHGRPGAAATSAGEARDQLDTLLGGVTVETPGQPISRASGSAPLLVFVSSKLPVTVNVQITLQNNSGLKPAPAKQYSIAAGTSQQAALEVEALRVGRFSVDVSLTTPGGTQLGSPATFELRSSEYSTVTIIITVTAAGALLLLSGRRIYRRIRARSKT